MSQSTRREILIWSVAAVGAVVVGAGITLASGRKRGDGASLPPIAPPVQPGVWHQTAAWPLPIQKAVCLTSAGGRLVVGGDRTLLWLGAQGQVEERCDLAGEPRALTSAPDGSVWSVRAGAVERVVAGKPEQQASLPATALPCGLALGGGLVWVSDFATRTVLRFHPDGSAADPIRAGGVGSPDGFIIPSPFFPIAAGHDGNVWVSHTGRHRLEGYNAQGELVRQWGKAGMDVPGFCGCCNPAWFQVLPDGRFITAEKGQPRIKLYAGDGSLIELVANRDVFSPDVQGLEVVPDGHGGLAVLDPQTRSVRIFRSNA